MLTDDTPSRTGEIALHFDVRRSQREDERGQIGEAAARVSTDRLLKKEAAPFLFVHVPKTAGSSLYSIFRTILQPSELLKLHPNGETLLRINALSERHVTRLRILYGHVDVQLAREILPLQQCVTLLRDPVDRIVSYYAFVKHMNSGLHSELARRTSITQWIDALRLPETDNGMVRRFSGALYEAGIGACTRQMLERAKANLAQFALVGLTDRFDEFYALLANRLGLPMRTYVVSKVNTKRPRSDQLRADTLAQLEQRNALDRELYRFAEELHAEQLSKIDLSTEIDEFRRRDGDRSMRIRDAVRRIAFARWKKLRRRWSLYPFLG
ncbi:MAG: sulfotransferase family 2 domain-containing protein [Casimicrobiaceae bacterium]